MYLTPSVNRHHDQQSKPGEERRIQEQNTQGREEEVSDMQQTRGDQR